MAKCKKCGNFYSPYDSFCSKCGLKVPKYYLNRCSFCKNIVSGDDIFCTKCGKKVDKKKLIKEEYKKI